MAAAADPTDSALQLQRPLIEKTRIKIVDVDTVTLSYRLGRAKICRPASLHTNCLCDGFGYLQWKLFSLTEFFVASIIFSLHRFRFNVEKENDELKKKLESSILDPNAAAELISEHKVLMGVSELLDSIGQHRVMQFSSTSWDRCMRFLQARNIIKI